MSIPTPKSTHFYFQTKCHLIRFALIMLAGAASSKYITPETCDSQGNSLELSDLGVRAARMEALRQREDEFSSTEAMNAQQMVQIKAKGSPNAV